MWAIVPAKSFGGAKQRLSAVLSPEERAELFAAMLDEVVATLLASKGLKGIVLVTNERRAEFYAGIIGVHILPDREERGQSAAVRYGAEFAASLGARSVVAVPGDVPLASPSEIETILAVHGTALAANGRAVTIVPSRDGTGTNALALSPPDLVTLHFGVGSFEPHCAAAREAGVEPSVLRMPGIELDVDTPDDLREWLRRDPYCLAADFLERLTGAP